MIFSKINIWYCEYALKELFFYELTSLNQNNSDNLIIELTVIYC